MGWPGLHSVSSLSSPHNPNCLSRHHGAQCQLPQQHEKNILQGQTFIIKCFTWKWWVTSAYTLGRTRQRGPGKTTLIKAQEREKQKDTTLIGLSWQLKALMFVTHLEERLAPCYMLHKYLLLLLLIIIIKLNKFITLEAIIKSGFSLLNFIWLNVSRWLFSCSPLATSECQYPIEITLTNL